MNSQKPHNAEAEMAVLGSIILDPKSFNEVEMAGMTEEHFYLPPHKLIYRTIKRLINAGEPVDELSLCDVLRDGKKLQEAGGKDRIFDLKEAVVSTSSVPHYVKIVIDNAIKRQAIDAAQEIIKNAETLSADELLSLSNQKLKGIQNPGAVRIYTHLDTLHDIFDYLQSDEKPELVRCGLQPIDKIINGWPKKTVTILAAKPGVGKTAILAQWAVEFTRQGSSCAIMSVEMDRVQLVERLLSWESGINPYKIRQKNLNENEHKQLTDAIARLPQDPIAIDDRGDVRLKNFESRVRYLVYREGKENIFVDYLQLLGESNDSRRLEIDAICAKGKDLAKELNCRIFFVSALSRVPESAGTKSQHPNMGQLKESSGIDYAADIIIFFDRKAEAQEKETRVIVKKWRSGRTGATKIYFNPIRMRFYDNQQDATPPEEEFEYSAQG